MKEKKKKNKKIIYLWHPVLLRVYDNIHFQRLLASATSPIRANSKICSSPVLYTLASNPTKKGETSDKNEEELRLICSPLLVVSLWTEQSSPPSKNLLIKKSLTENEIEEIIVSELFRLICFTAVPEPFLCENIRRLINKTISKSVKVSILGDKNLSQTDFGLLVGLTREQMAHGASDPRNNPSSTKTIVRTSPMNMQIFSTWYVVMANDVVDDSQSNEKNLSTSPDKFDDFQEIEAIIFPPDPLNLSMDWQILHEVVRFKLKELVSAQSIKLHPTFLSLVDAEIKWIEGLPFTHDPKFDYHAEAKKLRETIKSLHVIGKYHLIDGILAELNHSVTLNGDLFKSLKKITILTVIALIRINTVSNVIEDKVIEEAIRNIRLFSEDRRSSFAKYISDIPFESQFDDIIESIHEQMKNSVQENSVKRLIANLHQILNRLYSHTAKRENSIFGDREQKDTKLEEISDYYIDNVRINVLSDISWAKGKKKPAAWSEEEQLGNTRHQSTYLITDHKPKIQNLSARAQQVKSVAQSISIRTQALPCSSSTFSRTQIQKVVHVLIQKISDGNIASLQLFLQLLFGMTQAELNSLPASSKQISKKDVGDNICWLILHKDIFYLQRLVKVANSTIHKKLSTLLPSSDVFIKLPLPELLKPILKPTLLVNNFNEETSKVFAEIYKKTGIIITQTQFSNYLVRWLQQTRVDQGVAGILAGKTAKQCAPIAYSFIEADRIITIWQEYMTTLGLPVNIEMSKKAVGSRLYPNSETFIQLIHVYQQYVQSYLRSRKSKRSPANWHNLFIRHCLLILNLSTGARPVTDMYGVRQDYCLRSRMIRISDKEARSVPAGRLIPLTDVAVKQLQYLERHLRHMADQFQYKYPELAIAAKNALKSTGPLLFWVNEPVAIQQSVSYQVESITPTSLANYFDNVLPLPVNWHRHAVRSYLLSKNVSTVLIDAVLGHEDMGHEYTNTMSGASLRELFEIPRVLDDWFSELKLECIEGW